MPNIDFALLGAEAEPFAASPTLAFKLRIRNQAGQEPQAVPPEEREDEPIEAMLLHCQLHIEPRWRSYDPATQERLRDLFGPPQRWGDTLRSLLWARVNLTVPAFRGEVTLPLPVPCSYDLEVAASKYFHALPDGYVQLTALFSGSIFSGGQVQPVPWDKEAHYRLPVRLWQEAMDRHFPNSAWLRVQRDVFDRLCLYRSRRALPSWEQVFEELLAPTSDEVPA